MVVSLQREMQEHHRKLQVYMSTGNEEQGCQDWTMRSERRHDHW